MSNGKNIDQLINNISGQLEGIKGMINKETDCIAVITQMKAVKSAFNSMMTKYINENVQKCINSNEVSEKEKINNLVKELVNN